MATILDTAAISFFSMVLTSVLPKGQRKITTTEFFKVVLIFGSAFVFDLSTGSGISLKLCVSYPLVFRIPCEKIRRRV